MKHSIFLFLLLMGIGSVGFSQTWCAGDCLPGNRYFAEISGGISTKSEFIGSLELGLRPSDKGLYFGVSGQVFTARRDKDQTAHVIVAPKIYYSFPIGAKSSIDPFVGGAYQYGGNETYQISEVGPLFGSKLRLGLKNNGYFFVQPSIVLTSNRLYSLGVGFGGFF